jgi:hypothetical protein
MKFESWWENYQPVVNPNGRAYGVDDTNYMFETYGQELAEVHRVRSVDESLIWTIVETERGDVLIEGYHFVNRVGYFIASVGYTGGPIDIPLAEPALE